MNFPIIYFVYITFKLNILSNHTVYLIKYNMLIVPIFIILKSLNLMSQPIYLNNRFSCILLLLLYFFLVVKATFAKDKPL